MKKNILKVCFLLTISLSLNAQSTKPSTGNIQKEERIYVVVEKQAEYPDGQAALFKWLSENIRYPEIAKKDNIERKVITKFTIEKDGAISNAVIGTAIM